MILSDKSIQKRLDGGSLVITPMTNEALQPASVDMSLGDEFLEMEIGTQKEISLSTPINYKSIKSSSYVIAPHQFVLATTKEYIEVPADLTALVEGRSSIGRMGLFIQNAGWVDPGFKGNITLELYNASNVPIRLEAGRRICQLVFCQMTEATDNPYKGKYQGQRTVVGSRVSEDGDSRI